VRKLARKNEKKKRRTQERKKAGVVGGCRSLTRKRRRYDREAKTNSPKKSSGKKGKISIR